MSNYNNLKSSINNNIYENQTQQITGTVLNAILNEMTNALGAGYQFAGVATVGMTPSEPDARIFYLAGEGIYTSFDGIQVPAGKLGILKWDNRWHLETIDGLGSGGANLTGYVTVASTDDLPDEGVATLGYLCGENLYLYVGEGGDTKEGKYQNCGSFRGPQGDSVQDVEQTQTSLENGGINKIKFTLSNGISCEFQVRNGTTSSGLFPTLADLQAAYPSPVVGQYAFVGSGFPADIYICTTAGTWTDSGEDYDGDNVDLTDYALKSEVNELELKVDVLDVESTTETVNERIPYNYTPGYIASYNQLIPGPGTRVYSDPIFLKAGESLKIKGITQTNVGRLASYNPDTQAITTLLMGASAAASSASDAYENTYTAVNDIYLIVGWYRDYYQLELTKTYDKTTTTSRLDSLSVIEDALGVEHTVETITENVQFTPVTGKFFGFVRVGSASYENSNSLYAHTPAIPLKAGDILDISVKNVAATASVIAYEDKTNNYLSVLAGDASSQTVQYTVPVDGNYYISYVISQGITLTKTYTKDEYSVETLDEIEQAIQFIPGLQNDVDNLKDAVTTVVEDDLTTFTDGYFINHNGALSQNSSFGYKEFSVRTGAVIVFTANEHPNLAAIAKKISATKYQELVPATAQTVQTFNYTATENMTIAVSFYNNYDRSISITTQNIESNAQNIDNIFATHDSDVQSQMVQDIDLGFLFDKVAVIGDSMSVATMDGYAPPIGASWLSLLGKRWDCDAVQHYAAGGSSAYTWLNSTTFGLGKLLSDDTIYNAYFIAYGHNDNQTVGDATDEAAPVTITGGVPSCPSGYTFCAYYKAVINQIRTKAPHAMIFCLSQYDYSMAPGGWHEQYGEAVIAIAEAAYEGGDKLIHHLDTGGVPDTDLQLGTHYSTIGYAYIAKRVNDEVNKVIYQYRADTEIKTFGVYNL